MKQCVFWCSLLLGITIFSEKGWCKPTDDYIGDEEEAYDDKDDEEEIPVPIMKSNSSVITALVGETIQLPCLVENGENYARLWINITTPLFPQSMFTEDIKQMSSDRWNILKNSSIEVKHLKLSDSGVYSCEITYDKGISINHTLVVKAPTPPNTKATIVSFKPGKDVSVRKGDPLSLTCEGVGNPEPKITWSKNDNKNNEARMQEDGTVLTIDSVTRKNSGIYTCNAQNNLGTDSKSITVHVHYTPEIEMEEDLVMTGDEVSVNLICTVHATPRPKVVWLKDGKIIPTSSHMVSEKNKYTLHIPKVKPEDFGNYTCEASNNEGRSESAKLISGKPKKPVLETTKDASDAKKPVMVWKIQSFSPITNYEVLFKNPKDNEWKSARYNMDKEQKDSFVYSINHSFDNIPSEEYETKLRAKNKYGWSDISDVHFFTKDDEGVLTESGSLESADRSSATELRISAVFVTCLFIARLYC